MYRALENDKEIIISTAGSRKAKAWLPQRMKWSEFLYRINLPVTSQETLEQYKAMPKARQDDLKDVGGYVGGILQDNRRKSGNVAGRYLITLDADSIPPGETQVVINRVAALGCAYAIYNTRKHAPYAPRLRIILPTDRMATAEEYEPLARKVAEMVGIGIFDPTTFEASRMMYWPSRCSDGEVVFTFGDKPFLSVDGVLGMYGDWKNVTEWASIPGMEKAISRKMKQQDPETKGGIIGAFCQVYDIPGAIDTFLPEVYTDCGGGRYTYMGGSTTAGAVMYDNGKFLYSHHATDPCSGMLVNAFDLVRIHKFSGLDEGAADGAKGNTLPSYKAMCQFAMADGAVKREKLREDFGGIAGEDGTAWLQKLDMAGGKVAATTNNVQLILENDPELAGKFYLDEFLGREVVTGSLPWKASDRTRCLKDSDMAGLRVYLETVYGIVGKAKIQDAFDAFMERNASHVVRQYLDSLVWDGEPRLDSSFIEYLGADDSYYVRMSARKTFCAAVARIYTPGAKFDYMPTLIGPQGIGKSTFFRIVGKDWFTDSLRISDMKDKTGAEKLLGHWIIEAPEMDGMNRTDSETVKAFLSQTADVYRPAYGKRAVTQERQSIIVGTCNNPEFLKDGTGNRRFWPIDCGVQPPLKSVFNDLQEAVDQMWAEAIVRWRAGEPLYPDAKMDEEALVKQESHRQEDPRKGMIEEFLKIPLPEDWQKWDADRRRFYDPTAYKGATVPRRSICAAEIWVECFKHPHGTMEAKDSRGINAILRGIFRDKPEWAPGRFYPGAGYGRQRGFILS